MEGEEEIWECDSTFWSATLQPVVADQDFMPHIKAKHVPFQIMHGSFICHQRLQSGKPKCWITLSDFLFPFHNLTWGFCFCLHIIPLFCRFGGDKHPGTADISFYPNSMGTAGSQFHQTTCEPFWGAQYIPVRMWLMDRPRWEPISCTEQFGDISREMLSFISPAHLAFHPRPPF